VSTKYRLTIIVPVYNEEDNLIRLEEAFNNYFLIAKAPSKVLFVNDGSIDKSQQMIEDICTQNEQSRF